MHAGTCPLVAGNAFSGCGVGIHVGGSAAAEWAPGEGNAFEGMAGEDAVKDMRGAAEEDEEGDEEEMDDDDGALDGFGVEYVLDRRGEELEPMGAGKLVEGVEPIEPQGPSLG